MEPATPPVDEETPAFRRGDFRAVRRAAARPGATDGERRDAARLRVDPVVVAIVAACLLLFAFALLRYR